MIPFKVFRFNESNFTPDVLAPVVRHSTGEGFNMLVRLCDEWLSGANTFCKNCEEALYGAGFEGKILGIGGRCHDASVSAGDSGVLRVRYLYVVPEWRHVGVGSALLKAILDVSGAAEKQVGKFTLRTDNPAARKFYKYHGFKYTGEGDVTHEFEL